MQARDGMVAVWKTRFRLVKIFQHAAFFVKSRAAHAGESGADVISGKRRHRVAAEADQIGRV
ncbi:hypothetical protein L0337_30445 [candidate division KSB1 bacterium]|nr:hypothetical protein [candidate division KSB1 bacterium]